jgi:cyclohexadieny/prephenate dehydrogenase
MFNKITIIGFGLIGSSLARKIREENIAPEIICADISQSVCDTSIELELANNAYTNISKSVDGSDLVIISVPVGIYKQVGEAISSHLKKDAIIIDVGSVKSSVIKDLSPYIPDHAEFIPSHPIAGTEDSGPENGFAKLFEGRWAIITPTSKNTKNAINKISEFWKKCGSMVKIMTPEHHDKVLGITSHLPHLIAFTIVGTATDLEEETKNEIIKYSAGGFRDFTRIAASNPTMWKDIFITNKDAVLDILQRFNEDLSELQKAIRKEDSNKLLEYFGKTSKIRKDIIEAKQDI